MVGKKFIVHGVLLVLLFIGLFPIFYFSALRLGQAEAAQGEPITDTTNPIGRSVDNMAFGVGEKLSFEIKYGFISAGTATMEVSRLVEYEGRPCYQIVTKANSNSFFSSVYKVEDRVESIMDAAGLYSWRFEKILREGNYRSDRQYDLDQRNHRVINKNDTISIPSFTQDALSTMYYVRTQPLEVGKSVFIDDFIDGKLYHLEAKVLDRETVTVEAGSFDCFVIEPITQSVGIFKHEGKLKIWLTADRLRMPVLMKSKVMVGSIAVELTDYKLGSLEEF